MPVLRLILWGLIVSGGWIYISWAGDIYYYQDEHGVLHFTDLPQSSEYELFYPKQSPAADKQQILLWIREYSTIYDLEPELVQAVLEVESGYQKLAVSKAGAQGLMQIMPGTQKYLGLEYAFDPEANIEAGVRYLSELWHSFSPEQALAAYNAGPAQVRRYQGIPPFPETINYVQKVLDLYSSLKK